MRLILLRSQNDVQLLANKITVEVVAGEASGEFKRLNIEILLWRDRASCKREKS